MKPFITKDKILKKLESAKAKKILEIKKHLAQERKTLGECPDSYWAHRNIKRLEKQLIGFKCVPGIPFKPKKGVFEGSSSYGGNWGSQRSSCATISHGLDPETGLAHSYEWYELGKIINGTYVVNSYSYSSSTRGHYYNLCNTLKLLGVKFIELEAPKGLQDLEASRDLYLNRIGEKTVSMKYGRKGSIKWRMRWVKDDEKMLKLLATLGIKSTKAMREQAMEDAEKSRAAKLAANVADREATILRAYERAKQNNDLQGIVKFHNINKKRVARGLPELKAS